MGRVRVCVGCGRRMIVGDQQPEGQGAALVCVSCHEPLCEMCYEEAAAEGGACEMCVEEEQI